MQAVLCVDEALVAGMKPAIVGEDLPAQVRLLVVAHQQSFAAHLDFTRLGINARLDTGIGRPDAAFLVFARQCQVRQRQVFGHAVTFVDRQTQVAVPGQQGHWHGCRATGSQAALVQPQGLE